VELMLDTHPDRYEWKEDLHSSRNSDWPSPPFPLQGRLNEWIEANTKRIVRP